MTPGRKYGLGARTVKQNLEACDSSDTTLDTRASRRLGDVACILRPPVDSATVILLREAEPERRRGPVGRRATRRAGRLRERTYSRAGSSTPRTRSAEVTRPRRLPCRPTWHAHARQRISHPRSPSPSGRHHPRALRGSRHPARRADGRPPVPSPTRRSASVSPPTAVRSSTGTLGFAELVARERLTAPRDDLRYFSRWITPVQAPRRYDARFFVAPRPGRPDAAARRARDDLGGVDAPGRRARRAAAGDVGVDAPDRPILEELVKISATMRPHPRERPRPPR